MKTLPNGLKIFNATPHIIRFWSEAWTEPVEIEPDTKIDARPVEEVVGHVEEPTAPGDPEVEYKTIIADLVRTQFVGTDEGRAIIDRAMMGGADLVVGSIIAAQAYPGRVVAMTPAPGYERVAPAEKRMNPDKFTIFS